MAPFQVPAAMPSNSSYRTLLDSFQAAYDNMKSSSTKFTAVLASLPAGLTDSERSELVAEASRAYEAACQEFGAAAANMNGFLISRIISSRPSVQMAARHH